MRVPDSEQLDAFLAVVRTGSTLAASRRLGVDHSTVSRRLTALEAAVGARLFDRSPRGLTPTETGARLVGHAERVESALFSAAASIGRDDAELTGSVRLATPEVFGTWLVAPHVGELYARHPNLTLELAPESRSFSLSKREADIAVTVRRPPSGRLIVRKMADYHLGLYAARAYIATAGPISNQGELHRHMLVTYIAELLDYPEMNPMAQIVDEARGSFCSSSSMAQQAAVAAGVGVGLLHRVAADRDDRLARVLPETIDVKLSYWLVMHTDMQRMPRVRAVIDFLDKIVQRKQADL